jgi:hypothetical protein
MRENFPMAKWDECEIIKYYKLCAVSITKLDNANFLAPLDGAIAAALRNSSSQDQ